MELVNNNYAIQGVSVEAIAQEFGTPLYVYDADRIKRQVKQLSGAFKGVDLKLKYASKALTNLNVVKYIKELGVGFDAVSINEVKLALHLGYAPQDIIYTPNCVHFDEVEEGIDLGVHVNIDNLPFLERIGQKYGSEQPVCLRLNPHIEAGGNKNIQVGHIGSKFGISILQFDEILEIVNKYSINVEGLHVHTGSDILDVDVFLRGAEIVFERAVHFRTLEFLDFGSGFKVAYYKDAPVTNIEELGERMSSAFKEFCADYGKKLQIWFEPGKFLVSEAGTFLTEVNLIKQSPACTFIGLNTGFNHLMRPMLYDAHHDIVNVSNPGGKEKVYNVVGNICETDTFASDRKIEQAKEGDLIAFKNAGAYGFEMSSNFNSRLKPAEVMVVNGEPKLIRKRQVFEDLLRDQVEIDF
jgi:diaminopimelate decarboxylase